MDILTQNAAAGKTSSLETFFRPFREKVIGYDQTFRTPFGEKRILYADWTASGRLYGPIEDILTRQIAPFVGNTHTETSVTGSTMTMAYHRAKDIIKRHIGANPRDVLISSNSGMTGVVNKFQRILGLKVHEKYHGLIRLAPEDRPVIFVSHMEHHSNQTSWLMTLADVEVIRPTEQGLVDIDHLHELLQQYEHRKTKIAAVTSCSNVTGIKTPYYEIASIMHRAGGLVFVDFACSAPYVEIDMRPDDPLRHLDAIYFSPHKFLGGPGSTGILVFDPKLYTNRVPDNPGGGTVDWTNPWGGHKFIDEIESREDGGTPAFLQTIKVALACQLKDAMGVDNILAREKELLDRIWPRLDQIPGLHLLADAHRERLGVISFYIEGLHYNLAVKLLNDHFGVQVRGGCSCAGTYGHYLLHVSQDDSRSITEKINLGDLSAKPGWIRMSIHPVMTDEEVDHLLDALEYVARNFQTLSQDYDYNPRTNEFTYRGDDSQSSRLVEEWFDQKMY